MQYDFSLCGKYEFNIELLVIEEDGGGVGGSGPLPPTTEKLQSYRCLSNSGPDPMENHKATS